MNRRATISCQLLTEEHQKFNQLYKEHKNTINEYNITVFPTFEINFDDENEMPNNNLMRLIKDDISENLMNNNEFIKITKGIPKNRVLESEPYNEPESNKIPIGVVYGDKSGIISYYNSSNIIKELI